MGTGGSFVIPSAFDAVVHQCNKPSGNDDTSIMLENMYPRCCEVAGKLLTQQHLSYFRIRKGR